MTPRAPFDSRSRSPHTTLEERWKVQPEEKPLLSLNCCFTGTDTHKHTLTHTQNREGIPAASRNTHAHAHIHIDPNERMPPKSGEAKHLLSGGGGAKGFQYDGEGRSGDTDEFLAGLTGAKPKYRPPAKYEPSAGTGTESITSNYYDGTEGSREKRVCGVAGCRTRALMIAVACVLMAGGAALIAFLNHNVDYLKDLWPMSYFAVNVLGALYIVGGVVSIAAAVADKDLWRRAALFLLVLACAGVIMGFTLATLMKTGKQDAKLLSDWQDMVREDPDRICAIQHDLNCTGWTVPCPAAAVAPTTTMAPSTIPSPTSAPTTVAPNVSSAPTAVEKKNNAAAATEGDGSEDGSYYGPLTKAYRDSGLKSLHALLLTIAVGNLGNHSTPADECVASCALAPYHNVNQTCAKALQAQFAHDYPAAIVALVFALVWTVVYGALVYVKREVPTGYGSLQA